MSINKLLLAGVAGTFFAGSAAMAAEPVKLTDAQMDDVTAGFFGIGSARLTLGVRLVNTEAQAGRQVIETSTWFDSKQKDSVSFSEDFKFNANGECGTTHATSKLSSKLNTGSSTKLNQRGGSYFGTSSLKASGTLNIQASNANNGPF